MFRELIAIALSQISAAKGRSFLTILGILIGIMTIILITTVLESYSSSIIEDISRLGANVFQVQRYENRGGFHRRQKNYRPPIDRHLRDYIYENCEHVRLVGAEYWKGGRTISFLDKETNPSVSVFGATPEFSVNNAFDIALGRDLTENDIRSGARIAIIGFDVLSEVFPPNLNPLGRRIQIDGYFFRVVGVFQKKKETTFGGTENNLVLIPITAFASIYGEVERSANITVQAVSAADFKEAIDEVIAATRKYRKVPPKEENNFYIISNETVLEKFNTIADTIKLVAFVIGFISLLVGAIGVMNIMLVSVTERTKEIGIRKALGARRANILFQFLFEAVILSVIGAVLGILLGVGLGAGADVLLKLPVVIPIGYLIAGVIGTSLIGIVAGLYPAWKASRLNPIDALRYE